MKLKHDKPIIQYDLNGNELNRYKKEHEITKEMGYYRVWDCGTTRYELKVL